MSRPTKAPTADSPEQTYLNERLQSARWLGWNLPAPTAQIQSTPKAQSVVTRLAVAVGLAAAPVSGKPSR